MPIRVLEPQVVAKIAAGEVVERPASVVKELVENALDAGASHVTVEVEGGGVQGIRVVDDGVGIPAEEVELAFHRHATSKLESFHDLTSVVTLGFRGEALPSIAAVAQVSLLTRPPDALSGVVVEVRDGGVVRRQPRGSPPGTSVTVRHLFRNVPARLKFLRSAATEAGYVQDCVARFILAFPQVAFLLELEGRRALASPGTGAPREAIAAVYGAEVAGALLEVASPEGTEAPVSVRGFLSPPSLHRANRNAVSLFVNGRWVQSRSLTYAVAEAYQGFLPERRYPLAILYLTLPCQEVDVNAHPAKREVRLRREGEVFAAVQRAVRATLVGAAPVPSLHVARGARRLAPPPTPTRPRSRHPQEGQEALALIPPRESPDEVPPPAITPGRVLPLLRVLGQVQGTYIVAEGPDGLYLIDQHAGHERVVYEQVRQQVQAGGAERQGLLEPVAVETSPPQEEALRSHEETLARYGFAVEPFGPGAYLVRAVPSPLRHAHPGQALAEVLEALQEGGQPPAAQEERLAATIACHGAIRAGQTLTHQEMVELVRSLEQAQEPHTCPHGRPTIIHLSAAHLEREFGRR